MLVRSGGGKADLADEAILVDFAMRYGDLVCEELDEGPVSALGEPESQGGFRFQREVR